MTAEVHLEGGEYGQMALANGLPYTGRPNARSRDSCGDHFFPSNTARGIILTHLKVIWDMSAQMRLRGALSVWLASSLMVVAAPADATWSIVAADARTREVGIAAATCYAGSQLIAGVVPGRGVVAAQGLTSLPARDRAIELLIEGVSPAAILAGIISAEVDRDWFFKRWLRQFGVASLAGAQSVAEAYTGPFTLPWRGDRQGHGVSVQGNVLRSASVLERSLSAFTSTPTQCGLAVSLLLALEAGATAGGDRRCSVEQTALSAFLIVARPGDPPGEPFLRLVAPDQTPGGDNPVALLRELFRKASITSGLPSTECGL